MNAFLFTSKYDIEEDESKKFDFLIRKSNANSYRLF
jgi:hypothetical protein